MVFSLIRIPGVSRRSQDAVRLGQQALEIGVGAGAAHAHTGVVCGKSVLRMIELASRVSVPSRCSIKRLSTGLRGRSAHGHQLPPAKASPFSDEEDLLRRSCSATDGVTRSMRCGVSAAVGSGCHHAVPDEAERIGTRGRDFVHGRL